MRIEPGAALALPDVHRFPGLWPGGTCRNLPGLLPRQRIQAVGSRANPAHAGRRRNLPRPRERVRQRPGDAQPIRRLPPASRAARRRPRERRRAGDFSAGGHSGPPLRLGSAAGGAGRPGRCAGHAAILENDRAIRRFERLTLKVGLLFFGPGAGIADFHPAVLPPLFCTIKSFARLKSIQNQYLGKKRITTQKGSLLRRAPRAGSRGPAHFPEQVNPQIFP